MLHGGSLAVKVESARKTTSTIEEAAMIIAVAAAALLAGYLAGSQLIKAKRWCPQCGITLTCAEHGEVTRDAANRV
jgi:hypothetical protein